MFLEQLLNGLTLGSTYALIALGYTMVYGIVQLINFAHGEVYMIGAFVGLFLVTVLGANIFVAMASAMVFCMMRCCLP
jgi:branched-chain amino acid transport system permease protein